MSPELLIMLLLGSMGGGGAGLAVWLRRAQRQYVARIQSEWVHAGHIIHAAPVGASCFGLRPVRIYSAGGVFGALGLTGDHLVFSGMSANKYDLHLPFDQVRLIALGGITIWAGKTTTRVRALVVHFESVQGWQTAVFRFQDSLAFAETLGRECGLPVYDTGKQSHDFGPARAVQMTQDIYGEWSSERSGDLYLVPDRLVFDGRAAVRLADIRRLDVIERPSLNPLAPDLLRIEHETAGGEIAVTGWVVSRASRWADAIARHTGEPLIVQSGRKKK